MNRQSLFPKSLRTALAAALVSGAALSVSADTAWMILPKASTSGLMLMHVSRNTNKKTKLNPNLMFDGRKQYGGKYKFLRIRNNDACTAGINEKGLGVIITGGDPTDDKNPPKTNLSFDSHSATVVMLRTCATAQEALNRMRAAFAKKQILGSTIYLIADPFEAFVVECSPAHFASWKLPHAFCTYTHCWKLPGMDDGSVGTADRAQWHYQCEWAAREFLRREMEKNKGMIPIAGSIAVSRINANDTEKKTVVNAPCAKNTAAAYTLELDPEYPEYLSCVYVAFGSPRHTIYLPVPFIASAEPPKVLLNNRTVTRALEKMAKADPKAPVDPALIEQENKILSAFIKTRNRARQLLREDRNDEAKKLLIDNMNKQAAEIAEFLNK